MADTFSRESLVEYAKQPQTTVAEDTNPFAGATPAKVADPAALAAVQSGEVDATPAAKKQDNADAATPSGDADVTEDQTDSGDGTSDETADTSTAAVDSGDDVETSDGAAQAAPKKGSARERIVEVLDLAEGYKEYGKMKAAEAAELKAELARLKSPARVAPVVPSIADTPMPQMEDPDVNFDDAKLRAKTEAWINARAEAKAESAFQRMTRQAETQKILDAVDVKVTAFKASHEDFDTVVSKNQVLQENQLAPDAALAVARSEFTAELLYKFGQDPKLAVRTAKLSPSDQREVIGEMIGQLRAEKAAAKNPQTVAKTVAKKSITQATPPPTATKAAGRPNERDLTDPTVEMDEFARRHREGKVAGRERSRELRARR